MAAGRLPHWPQEAAGREAAQSEKWMADPERMWRETQRMREVDMDGQVGAGPADVVALFNDEVWTRGRWNSNVEAGWSLRGLSIKRRWREMVCFEIWLNPSSAQCQHAPSPTLDPSGPSSARITPPMSATNPEFVACVTDGAPFSEPLTVSHSERRFTPALRGKHTKMWANFPVNSACLKLLGPLYIHNINWGPEKALFIWVCLAVLIIWNENLESINLKIMSNFMINN